MNADLKEKVARLLRFGVVGGIGTGLYLGIALGMVHFGATVMVAHLVAYAISIVFSYLGQKIVTFGVRGDHRRMGPRFAIATAAIAGVQLLIVGGLDALGVSKWLIVAISTAYYPVASFVVHSFWTFRQSADVSTPNSA